MSPSSKQPIAARHHTSHYLIDQHCYHRYTQLPKNQLSKPSIGFELCASCRCYVSVSILHICAVYLLVSCIQLSQNQNTFKDANAKQNVHGTEKFRQTCQPVTVTLVKTPAHHIWPAMTAFTRIWLHSACTILHVCTCVTQFSQTCQRYQIFPANCSTCLLMSAWRVDL